MSEFVLDVGCGTTPRGDVNVDVTLAHKGIPNFVRASGEFLPFRHDSFNHVVSINTVEHVLCPERFFSELVRVSRSVVEIAFPHRLGDSKENWKDHCSPHLHWFNVAWFLLVAQRLGLVCQREEIRYRHWPFLPNGINQYLGFVVRLPAQVTLTFRKPRLMVIH